MKKKVLASLLACVFAVSMALTGCSGSEAPAADSSPAADAPADNAPADAAPVEKPTNDESVKVLNLWSFTDEIPNMVNKFVELHPDFPYEIKTTIIATTDGLYQPALDQALAAGGPDAPDMYGLEAAFVLKYTQGEAAQYAATYKELGIDIDKMLADSQIAQYSVDIGTRDGEVVALGYQATGGAFIYRRSIAKDVWGTDEPAEIAKKIAGPGWDNFFAAAEELKAKGYAIVSGDGDPWHAIENSSEFGWLNADGELQIAPARDAFMDLSKKLYDNGYMNDTEDWTEGWYADMNGSGPKEVLGFFGPAWLINYTLGDNCGGTQPGEGTYGDWAVCESTEGFCWGGTWIAANKDSKIKEAVGQIIEWITLDATETGLQYFWANGTMVDGEVGTKDTVASGAVMAISNGEMDFLGGQNMFDVFIPAGDAATGRNMTPIDESINKLFRAQVKEYKLGNKSKEDAIAAFKQNVSDELGVTAAE
jgi:hypothetical protein